MAKVPLIHNPAAGRGLGTMRFREAEALLAVKGIEVQLKVLPGALRLLA